MNARLLKKLAVSIALLGALAGCYGPWGWHHGGGYGGGGYGGGYHGGGGGYNGGGYNGGGGGDYHH